MKVTTFYSFKGGLGRSLLLSWAARQMAADGASVIALDFDLEAPGLAYKFGFTGKDDMGPGLVGLLRQFQLGEAPPASLVDHLRPVPGSENLWLLPAGPLDPGTYWKALAGISWESLLRAKPVRGMRFFQWLRESLETQPGPDHLFIDARTGVTEMGGVALSVLADQVLALTGTSEESVVGTREVLRSCATMPQTWGSEPPRLGVALSRTPATMGSVELQKLRRAIKGRITEPADPLTSTLEIELPLVIRSEPNLQIDESQALHGSSLRVHEDYQAVLGWIQGAPVPTDPPGALVPEDPSPRELEASIAHQRSLAEREPDQYAPDLAMSLMNLSAQLHSAGRPEEALLASREAVDIYRELTERFPGDYLVNLAAALNHLGASYSMLGRQNEGFEVNQESVHIYRRLAANEPKAFKSELAASLNNYGSGLSSLGRHDEALTAMVEAVTLRHQLAEKQPKMYRPDLAMSLNNLGAVLSKVGLEQEALQTTLEAVDIRRELADDSPSTFEPVLARSLTNLGLRYLSLEDYTKARDALMEAIELFRRSSTHAPGGTDSELAGSFGILGDIARESEDHESAAQAREEAVALYEQLALKDPARYEPSLAMSLLNLGTALKEVGRYEEARCAAERASRLSKKLFEQDPRLFVELYVGILGSLGSILAELHPEEAGHAYEEAIRVLITVLNAADSIHIGLGTELRKNLRKAILAGYRMQDPELLNMLTTYLPPDGLTDPTPQV